MRMFFNLLINDFRLIYRYNIFWISLLVTALYFLLFRWIEAGEIKDKLLVLIIFNDPALLGFLFIGVMVLFERDESSLKALSVTPVTAEAYLLSKVMALSLVATVCSLLMALSAKGTQLPVFGFVFASMMTAVNFSLLGVAVVAKSGSFNTYFVKAIGWILVLTLPFISFFEVWDSPIFKLFPTDNSLDLFREVLNGSNLLNPFNWATVLAIAWSILLFLFARYKMKKGMLL